MTQEEKLQEAKRLYKTANSDQRYVLESLFPELKESEDERIKKALVRFHKSSIDIDGIKGEDILAWLEKQGEKKPADLPNGEDYGIDSLYHAARILEKTLGEVDGYQSDDGILEHKCAIEAVKRLYKQPPAWSEEGEDILRTIISDGIRGAELDMLQIDWLKSLRDRVQPNQWKPSKEQMETLEYYMVYLTDCKQKEVLFGLYDQLAKL